jgi:hypothetical protein
LPENFESLIRIRVQDSLLKTIEHLGQLSFSLCITLSKEDHGVMSHFVDIFHLLHLFPLFTIALLIDAPPISPNMQDSLLATQIPKSTLQILRDRERMPSHPDECGIICISSDIE